NNGGDGFVVARCLHNRGVTVTAYLLGNRAGVSPGGDARLHLDAYCNSGGRLVEVEEAGGAAAVEIAGAALVVDAVLGTGLRREVSGLAAAAIGWIEAAPGPVVSVDLPSGVCADTGRICGRAVAADRTVTFGFPKRGHYLFPGAARCGGVRVVDIGIPGDILDHMPADLFLFGETDRSPLPFLPADAHKGSCGHVVVLGGSPGKAGAPGLAAWAALRSGAGLATVAWPRGLRGENRLPLEVMTLPLTGAGDAEDQWDRRAWNAVEGVLGHSDAVVIGPGMGTGTGAQEVLGRVLGSMGAPAVVDADALSLLAAVPELAGSKGRGRVLTPHPGEAARLLGTDAATVQADRIGAVNELARRFQSTVVLKGAGTLVASPGEATCLLAVGNPGMATAGAGDVLAGVIGALLARGMPPPEAARTGVLLHGAAGDRAAEQHGEGGLVAGDLVVALPPTLRRFSHPRPVSRTGPHSISPDSSMPGNVTRF
ncbi:MAG TPA: NAD(P)H-hydrate dehydratase, partial [Deferrisomatales bacterium]|nr:NAD(P)H-hydrate dehydratase [Deferrisomatales bacterium]